MVADDNFGGGSAIGERFGVRFGLTRVFGALAATACWVGLSFANPPEPWGLSPREAINGPARAFYVRSLWAPLPSLSDARGLALANCKSAVDLAAAPYKILRAQQTISGPEMWISGFGAGEARVTQVSDDTILIDGGSRAQAYVRCLRPGQSEPVKPAPAPTPPVDPEPDPAQAEPADTVAPPPTPNGAAPASGEMPNGPGSATEGPAASAPAVEKGEPAAPDAAKEKDAQAKDAQAKNAAAPAPLPQAGPGSSDKPAPASQPVPQTVKPQAAPAPVPAPVPGAPAPGDGSVPFVL